MTKNPHAYPCHPKLMPEPGNLGDQIRSRQDARGMTLRDYFAARALQGLMANKSNPLHFNPEDDLTRYIYLSLS